MTENQDQVLEECLAYFKARPVYKKLFEKLRDKYASLGYMGGTVILTGLKPEEKAQLGGFFQKDYTENKTVTISSAVVEKALAGSRFSELAVEEIIEAYFGEALTVKKEERQQAEERRRRFFDGILQKTEGKAGKEWLEKVLLERGDGYLILMKLYKENEAELQNILMTVLASIQELPIIKNAEAAAAKEKFRMERELLAVFAARTTGNPHYYDEGTVGDKLLAAFLKEYTLPDEVRLSCKDMHCGVPFGYTLPDEVRLSCKDMHCEVPFGYTLPDEVRLSCKDRELTYVERKNRLLYAAGILKDDLSNDTLVYGIHAQGVDGMLHEGIEGFCRTKEPVRLTLLTVGNLQKAWPQDSDGKVYVVENPAVFSILSQRYPDRSFICGNGQLRLATFLLMDLLKENCIFYYAGDFDPEGLLIAQRLKRRYGEKLILWNYREEWYEKYLSAVELSAVGLKKLEKVDIPELQGIKKLMYQRKRSVYQEAMMEVIIGDIAPA